MLNLKLLGQPLITLDGQPVSGFASDKVLALLCYLAIEGTEQRRDTLATLLWGDMPEDKARSSLRSALYNLQKLIPGYIESTRKTVTFLRNQPVWLDVAAFGHAAQSAEITPDILDHYRGPFLDGIGFRDADGAEEWLRQQRESLRLIALEGFKTLANQQVARGDWAGGVKTTRQLLLIEPWHEAAHFQLMLCLARQGETAAALQQYDTCKQVLADEIGIDPLDATVRLYERIKAARTGTATGIHNVPPDTTPFVGRADDLATLDGLLNDPSCRLLSIVGTGGIGKTRLAIATAARQIGWFLDGVVFVSLASVGQDAADAGQTEAIASSIAAAIGLTLTGGASAQSQVLADLHNRELLLILDNVEHLIDPIVPLIEALLAQCEALRLLVTSRERLLLQQEWLFNIDGLPFPDVSASEPAEGTEASGNYAAVDLFVQTARRNRPNFELSAEITPVLQLCQLVEGLPLGIELAAALTATQSTQAIADALAASLDAASTRYRNVPPRHRSLRATFDYSWALLSEPERTLLMQLSVFRGGFDRAAMQAVSGSDLATLESLIVKSLVRTRDGDRYDLHEVVRQYSAETLLQSPIPDLQSPVHRHCLHYTTFLKTLAATLNDPDHMRASQQAFTTDIDNIRAAWRYAVDQPLPDEVTTMSEAYIMYMESTGMYYEGVQQFSLAVEKLRDQTSDAGRTALAQVAWGLGWSNERVGNLGASEVAFDLAVENARIVEDGASLTVILRQYGLLELARGGLQKARGMLEESIAIADNEKLPKEYASAITILAATLNRMGLYDEALDAINESIRLKAQGGNGLEMAISQHNKGEILMRLGRIDEAEALYQQVFAFCEEVNETMGRIVSRKALGMIALDRGDTVAARSHFDYIYAQSEPISPHLVALANVRIATVDAAEGDHARAREKFDAAIVFLEQSDDPGNVAMVQELLGGVLIEMGDVDSAETHLRAAIHATRDEQPQIYLNALLHMARITAERGELDAAAQMIASVVVHDSAEAGHHARASSLRDRFNLQR